VITSFDPTSITPYSRKSSRCVPTNTSICNKQHLSLLNHFPVCVLLVKPVGYHFHLRLKCIRHAKPRKHTATATTRSAAHAQGDGFRESQQRRTHTRHPLHVVRSGKRLRGPSHSPHHLYSYGEQDGTPGVPHVRLHDPLKRSW
jgi:hypothetical protein